MKKLLLFPLFLLILIGCEKEETVLIKDIIEGSWLMSTYLRNGVDETTQINITLYTETYTASGTYTRSFNDINDDPISESGLYSIDEDDKSIQITNISSIDDFSDEHSTLSTSVINITTHSKTSLIYNFENGGDTHEFRFAKQ